jgi:hypothetical protein
MTEAAGVKAVESAFLHNLVIKQSQTVDAIGQPSNTSQSVMQ